MTPDMTAALKKIMTARKEIYARFFAPWNTQKIDELHNTDKEINTLFASAAVLGSGYLSEAQRAVASMVQLEEQLTACRHKLEESRAIEVNQRASLAASEKITAETIAALDGMTQSRDGLYADYVKLHDAYDALCRKIEELEPLMVEVATLKTQLAEAKKSGKKTTGSRKTKAV